MPKHGRVSFSVIRRLPRYYRFLGDLSKAGVAKISSRELSQRMGLTASQIRQDLNCFGGFGQQGYGYNIEQLQGEVASILGIHADRPSIIVGTGNIGRAIAANLDFDQMGFHLSGLFDTDPLIVGTAVRGLAVRDISELESFCSRVRPAIAVLTLPRAAAPSVCERLIKLGVTGFWNFSHYDLALHHPELTVENVHLGDSLMTLSYMMKEQDEASSGRAE